jgi:hypothetical protein
VPRLIYDEVEDVRQPLADRLVRARIAEQLVTFRLDNAFIIGQAPAPIVQPYEPADLVTERTEKFKLTDKQLALVSTRSDIKPAPNLDVARVNFIQRYNLLLESAAPVVAGPALPAAQETKPGQPLLPLIVDAGFRRGGLNVNLETHYHHQLERITETTATVSAGGIYVSYIDNEFAYRTPDNKLHNAGDYIVFSGGFPVADAATAGFFAVLGLLDNPYPLGRRLTNSEVYLDFHPLCYGLRLSVADALEVTQSNGQNVYFTSRTVRLTLSLGNVISTSREQVTTTGAP